MFSRLTEDIRTVFAKDPAARSVLEVLTCYPGLHAVWAHRVSHRLWLWKLRLLARLVSHVARFLTGVEIHPGVIIGRRFFIDHGIGVVIGETAEIGDDVLMYQGVVLGGTTLEKVKRHPTIRNGAVIGAGAIVLGPIVVGEGARVGAGSVVVRDVDPHTVVVGIPARATGGPKADESKPLEHGKLPDPVANAIQAALDEMDRRLKATREELERRLNK
ncbi:MAG: serine O-acetyltransferase [Candidatus Coatesbacteria bacterium]